MATVVDQDGGRMVEQRRATAIEAATSGIDKEQPIPVYLQLKNLLLADIVRGRYNPGDRLPTEHELCARYDISRTPVSRALNELAEQGVVVRHRKRGTFVSSHWVQRTPNVRELRVIVPEGPWAALLQAAAPPDIVLNMVTVELGDLHQYLVHAVADGRAPDLAVLGSVGVREFAGSGFLLALDELDPDWIEHEYRQDFAEPFVQANSWANHPVAVQAEADVAGLWYRRRALTGLGVPPPERWDELREICRALTRGRKHALVLPGGSWSGEATTYCLLALLASNGSAVLDDESVTLAGPRAVQSVEFLSGLVADGLVPAEVVRYQRDRPIAELASGRAALCLGGSYQGPALAAAAGLDDDAMWAEFGFAPLPAGPSGPAATLAGGMVHGTFRQAARPELAMRMLKEMVSPAALTRMSRQTGQIPPRRSALAMVAGDSPFLAQTATMLDHAVVRPPATAYARVSEQLQAMLERVLLGQQTPAVAVRHAAEMIGAITGLPLVATPG
jgi:multiple sugar transport system substrate-binding protein